MIIPGIIFGLKFSFAQFITVDTGAKPVDAMKESSAITKGIKWKLLGFYVVIGLVNIVGALVLMVGLLVSIPVSTFAMIYVYRELSKAKAGLLTQSAVSI